MKSTAPVVVPPVKLRPPKIMKICRFAESLTMPPPFTVKALLTVKK